MDIISWLKCLLYILSLVVWRSGGGQAVFILPEERTTGLGCIPDGTTVNYECTVVDSLGIGATVWRGGAFSCSGSPPNAITLLHPDYVSGTSATCGDLSAMSVGVVGTDYTSILTVTASTGLNGTMIDCTISDVVLEGFDTIRVGVVPSAPEPVVITFSNSGPPSSFPVSWSPPSPPVVGGISGYMFGVTGDCGDCMNMTVSADTLSVTCSGWTANDQTCTFEVKTLTQDCGFTSDAATNSITLSRSQELEVYFVNNTPVVTKDRIYAEFESNRPGVSLLCHLIRFDNTKEDCSSGQFEREGVPPGDYVLRIVARDPSNPQDKTVLRNAVSVPEDDEFCVVGLWNRGLTVVGNSATIEFYNIGVATRFECVLDRTDTIEDCTSPYTVGDLTSGQHHLRIIPLDCGRKFKAHKMRFTV